MAFFLKWCRRFSKSTIYSAYSVHMCDFMYFMYLHLYLHLIRLNRTDSLPLDKMNKLFMSTEQLASVCPSERSKIDQEKLAAQRKLEEERQRVERQKKLAEEREERMEKRGRVIEELIQTEKDFLASLSLIMETFLGPKAERVFI